MTTQILELIMFDAERLSVILKSAGRHQLENMESRYEQHIKHQH